jgi:hypothetical protein
MPAPSARHALLVGVSTYPNLSEGLQLKGPVNDVELFRQLLTERYHFPKENIHSLSEKSGEDRLPSRKNIEAEMRRLAEVAHAGDQVVILLAGHGSLQPQAAGAPFPQPDGQDRIFLPRDVGKWDRDSAKVANAIRGDEIGAWLRPIAQKGASLWVLVDSCHSGMGVRGRERAREVDPEAPGGLAIPHEVMVEARRRAEKVSADLPEKARGAEATPLPGLEGVVVFYACQPTEETIERDLPADVPDAKTYGLLAFTVCQVLAQADAPLTYLELAQRVHRRYADMGRVTPTPLVEGRERNREVLGLSKFPRRSLILLAQHEGMLTVNAGAVNGLTRGSVLAVYPPAGAKAERPLGHVRVTEVKASSAEVEPCDFQRQKANKDLPDGRCEVVSVDYGDLKLPVAIDPLDNHGKRVAKGDQRVVAEALRPLAAKEASLLALATDPAKAEWLVRIDAGNVYLVPGSGWSGSPGEKGLPPLFGPYTIDANLTRTLGNPLERVARARNLLKLAGAAQEGNSDAADRDDPPMQLKVEVRRLTSHADRKGEAVEWPNPAARLYDRDRVRLIIHNPNPYAVDITLLDVGPNCEITCLFPRTERGETSRIPAKSSFPVKPVKISGDLSGRESLVVVAVKAGQQAEPVDFSSLEEEGLEKAQDQERTRGVPRARGLGSPLGQLFQRSQYGVGTRTAREENDETALLLYSWQFVARKRP